MERESFEGDVEDFDVIGAEFYGFAAAGVFVGAQSVHDLGGEDGRHLLLRTDELGQDGLHGFRRDMIVREILVHGLLQIE